MSTGREDPGVGVLNNKLYAVGCVWKDIFNILYSLSSVERYDDSTNTWTAVVNMSTVRSSH